MSTLLQTTCSHHDYDRSATGTCENCGTSGLGQAHSPDYTSGVMTTFGGYWSTIDNHMIHMDMDMLNWHGFDYSKWYEDESRLIEPQLSAMGFRDFFWKTTERDSFGPLGRLVTMWSEQFDQHVQMSYG